MPLALLEIEDPEGTPGQVSPVFEEGLEIHPSDDLRCQPHCGGPSTGKGKQYGSTGLYIRRRHVIALECNAYRIYTTLPVLSIDAKRLFYLCHVLGKIS